MKWTLVFLLVTAAAFVAWIGYLAHLALTGDRPSITLSRPQFLVAEVVVVAHVKDKGGPVTVAEVLFPAETKLKAGDKVQVKNLPDSFRKRLGDAKSTEWSVPGDFIIPLWGLDDPEKGGPKTASSRRCRRRPGLPQGTLIYPATPDTLEQALGACERDEVT